MAVHFRVYDEAYLRNFFDNLPPEEFTMDDGITDMGDIPQEGPLSEDVRRIWDAEALLPDGYEVIESGRLERLVSAARDAVAHECDVPGSPVTFTDPLHPGDIDPSERPTYLYYPFPEFKDGKTTFRYEVGYFMNEDDRLVPIANDEVVRRMVDSPRFDPTSFMVSQEWIDQHLATP